MRQSALDSFESLIDGIAPMPELVEKFPEQQRKALIIPVDHLDSSASRQNLRSEWAKER